MEHDLLGEILSCLKAGIDVKFYKHANTRANYVELKGFTETGAFIATRVWDQEIVGMANLKPETIVAHQVYLAREELNEYMKPDLKDTQ